MLPKTHSNKYTNIGKLSKPIHTRRVSGCADSECPVTTRLCASPVPQDVFTDNLSFPPHCRQLLLFTPITDEDTEAWGGAVAFPRSRGHCPDHCPTRPSEHAPSLNEKTGPRALMACWWPEGRSQNHPAAHVFHSILFNFCS